VINVFIIVIINIGFYLWYSDYSLFVRILGLVIGPFLLGLSMSGWDDKRKEQYLRKTKFWKDGVTENERIN
jgi:hypothetical protein